MHKSLANSDGVNKVLLYRAQMVWTPWVHCNVKNVTMPLLSSPMILVEQQLALRLSWSTFEHAQGQSLPEKTRETVPGLFMLVWTLIRIPPTWLNPALTSCAFTWRGSARGIRMYLQSYQNNLNYIVNSKCSVPRLDLTYFFHIRNLLNCRWANTTIRNRSQQANVPTILWIGSQKSENTQV